MKKLSLIVSTLVVAGLIHHWAGAAVPAKLADEPIIVVTHVDVMPNFTAAGRELLKQLTKTARQDRGAVRFEVFEELNRPNHSTIVAIWKDQQAYEDHLATEQTRAYRAKLQPMLGSPFDERLHRQSL